MAKKEKKQIRPSELRGGSIYQDGKRTVYSPFYTKNGYVIATKDVQAYTTFVQSFSLSPFLFLLSYLITRNILICVILSLIFCAITLCFFYKDFVKNATMIQNFKKPKKENFFKTQAETLDTSRIRTIILCSILLSVCFVIFGIMRTYFIEMRYLAYICAVLSLIYGFLYIYILILHKKSENNR